MTITTAAKDVAGNPLAQLNSISFNTGPTPDTTQPKISSITPTDTATSIDPGALIKVLFSEPMNKVATQAAFSFLPAIPSSTQNFSWNPAGTQMIVYQNPSFAYGASVGWNVGPGAKDLSGNILENASSAFRSFTVIHKGTFKLYSDGSLDGAISDTGSVNLPTASDYIEQVGYSGKQAYKRGFITFDLQKLPKLALITTIQSASLHVYQDASQCGSPYSFLGNMLAENIDYPLLSFLFFDAAPVSTGTTNILSTDAAVGYKAMDATKQIGYDVQNHSGLSNRSQWRLRMTKDFPAQATNTCYFMFMATGMATQSKKPYLDITYLYP
jgi:Bacterial Ig-like domain